MRNASQPSSQQSQEATYTGTEQGKIAIYFFHFFLLLNLFEKNFPFLVLSWANSPDYLTDHGMMKLGTSHTSQVHGSESPRAATNDKHWSCQQYSECAPELCSDLGGGVPSCCSAKDKQKPLCLIWHDIEKWKRSRCCKPRRSQLKLLCPIPEENYSFMDQRPWVWKNILFMRLTEFYLDTSKRSCLNSLRLAFAETWKNNKFYVIVNTQRKPIWKALCYLGTGGRTWVQHLPACSVCV